MGNSKSEEAINDIIKKSFEIIKHVYKFQKESINNQKSLPEIESRILFPKYSTIHKDEGKGRDRIRISEQELRFIFVEQLNKVAKKYDLYYSVETPTQKKYVFSKDKGGPKVDENNGVSARTDLVIYKIDNDNFRRVALIEFKALNPVETNYQKDFCKLEHEECDLKYFIQIIKNSDADTIDNIKKKIANKKSDIIFRCYCLDRGVEIKLEPKECKSPSTAE